MDAPDQPESEDQAEAPPDATTGSTVGSTEVVAPPVVVVMVAHDPGPWLEEALRSVAGQTYRNTSILVLDTASDEPLDARIAAAAPAAHGRRLERNVGFGPACNEVLGGVEGAAFYLFCHDDVRLAPDAVQTMVEEAFRSNAGIVGPKLVRWDLPDRLLQVGMGADKTGAPAPYVERGELDQEQHDAVRDVFYVPGGATLVRADLFEALAGFDPAIELLGEDLDLAWRAHVVGARVLVAPGARVAHLEALSHRHAIDDRRRLQMRHRLRTSRVCYRRSTRLRVMPQAAFIAFVELCYGILTGRFRHAADVIAAWTWNVRNRRGTRDRRRLLDAHRAVEDEDVRRLQTHGSARWSAFVRGQESAPDNRIGSVTASGREMVSNLRSPSARASLLGWVGVLVLLAFGSRELFSSGVPAVGQFALFPGHPSSLLQQWTSGMRSTGLGSETASPTLFGALGALGYVFFGAMGLLRTVVIAGALPIGALGAWRLAGPLGSRRARITVLVVYVCLPLGFNAMARGRWDGLAMYAFMPWILNQLARGSRLAPYGDVGGLRGQGVVDRPIVQRVLLLGIITALASMVAPVAAAVVLGSAVALAIGGVLAGELRGALRLVEVGIGGVVVAAVLQLPWSATLLSQGWRAAVGLATMGGQPLAFSSILRFATGPFGGGILGWAFLLAAALVLAIGRGWRLRWAARCWVLVGASMTVTMVSQGIGPGWLPAPEVLLAPAAAGVALAAGLGMVSFEADLPDYHFGWRQVASVLAGAALVVGVLPAIGATFTGQWDLPSTDFASTLGNLGAKETVHGPYRVLWVGEAALVPGSPWALRGASTGAQQPQTALAYTSMSSGSSADDVPAGAPSVTDLMPGTDAGATARMAQALRIAARGGTTRLGALLAPMGVRYLVVPMANAPIPYETGPTGHPTDLLAVLQGQLDLADVPVTSGVAVFRNTAWGPTRAELPPDTRFPPGGPSIADRVVPALDGARTALPHESSYLSYSGSLANRTTVYLSQSASTGWSLTAGGASVRSRTVLGWAEAFDTPAATHVSLHYSTSTSRHLAVAGQVLLWLVVCFVLFRNRVRAQGERDLALLAVEGELA